MTEAETSLDELNRGLVVVGANEVRCRLWLPRDREELFPFFADAHNLERITPRWLRFKVLTPRPVPMHEGALIRYRLIWRVVPLLWRTRIAVWEPPERFVDEQAWGPYREWVHTHTFEPREGGTVVGDHVRFRSPLEFVSGGIVRRDVERIFRFRQEAMKELFGGR